MGNAERNVSRDEGMEEIGGVNNGNSYLVKKVQMKYQKRFLT